jgi:protein-S-isoprenylcysteine O-methyltransferase Ste14
VFPGETATVRGEICAYIRHPLYLALTCGAFGLTFLANNWIALGAALLQLIPALFVDWLEDRELVGRTGRAHEATIRKTGALLPRRDVLGFLPLLVLGLLPGGGGPG